MNMTLWKLIILLSVTAFSPNPDLQVQERSHIACLDVPTLRDKGTQALTLRKLFAYRVELACLSEVRLPGAAHIFKAVALHRSRLQFRRKN